jgi:dTMP kinase
MPVPEGLFLVLDGPDGGGKTTQVKRLSARIESAGRSVEAVRDPGGTAMGERVRAILLDPAVGEIDATTEMLLYQAARRRLTAERIRPALEAGRVVLCDRWHYATSAYQSAGGGADPAAVRLTSKIATDGLEPRRAILLDVPPAVAERRMARPLDRMESKGPEFRRRVAAEFRRIFAADPDRFVIVDATRSEDEVGEAVWEAVRDLL